MTRLKRDDPTCADHLPDVRRIIAFRNILVHNYEVVESKIVWYIVQQGLPDLLEQARRLLP